MSINLETQLDEFRHDHDLCSAGQDICSICRSMESGTPFGNQHDWLRRCADCGLMWASPQPSDVELADIYGPDYFRSFGFDKTHCNAYRRMKRMQAKTLLDRLPQIASVTPRLLDIGSALGDLLFVAKSKGYEAVGIESNAYAVEAADIILPGQTRCDSLDSYKSNSSPFDVVVCLEVIEHLRDPNAAFRKIHDLLRPGGILLLTTPDAGSRRAKWMGGSWYHIHRDHLWYFNQANLNRIVVDSRFEILSHHPAVKQFTFAYVLSVLSECPNSRLIQLPAKFANTAVPHFLKSLRMPAICEGQLMLARRPENA